LSGALFEARTPLPATVEEAFAYHDSPGALERLLPPWQNVRLVRSDRSLRPGSEVLLRLRLMGVPLSWLAEHTVYEPPRRFVDVQRRGPFRSWRHEHLFHPLDGGEQSSELVDRIEYKLPFGRAGELLGGRMIEHDIRSMFAYRHRVTRNDLSLKRKYPLAPMRLAISGASGLVGRNLRSLLTVLGHQVRTISRPGSSKRAADSSRIDDAIPPLDDPRCAAALDDLDAVVHLAGDPITEGRWTAAKKERIRSSRVDYTRRLCERLASLTKPPKTLLSASAIGYYGNRGEESLDEDACGGSGYLAEVAQQWESACQPAIECGIRVVHLRFGVILSPRGGALAAMLMPAKMCGGAIGNGQQWTSWITIDDCLYAIYHALALPSLHGAINVVAPQPVTNRDFASALAHTLHRLALFPAPAFALRLVLGEMADHVLLASTKVDPQRLQDTGFSFQFPAIDGALRHLLGK